MANIRIGPEVNVLPRSHIYRGYRPTYNIICSTYIVLVSAQQMNFLPENTSRNDTIFQSLYHIFWTTSQCLSLILSPYYIIVL